MTELTMLCYLNRAIGGGIRCRDERGWMPARLALQDIAGRWRVGPWDIASRAHILLRSSEFGLSGFRNYVQKGVNEGRRQELVGVGLIREKVSIEELTSGSRRKELSAIRGRIVIGLVEK